MRRRAAPIGASALRVAGRHPPAVLLRCPRGLRPRLGCEGGWPHAASHGGWAGADPASEGRVSPVAIPRPEAGPWDWHDWLGAGSGWGRRCHDAPGAQRVRRPVGGWRFSWGAISVPPEDRGCPADVATPWNARVAPVTDLAATCFLEETPDGCWAPRHAAAEGGPWRGARAVCDQGSLGCVNKDFLGWCQYLIIDQLYRPIRIR